MSNLRRILAALLFLALTATAVCPVSAAIPYAYWAIQRDYLAAVENGDDDALLDAVDRLSVLYANPTEAAHHSQLAFPTLEAAKIYEKRGNFDAAADCYRRALPSLRWLNDNGTDYYDLIVLVEALLRHCTRPTEVYALSTNSTVHYGALHEPAVGTYFGACGDFVEGEQSAYLLYVHFYNENIADLSWLLPKSDDYLLELAWNMPNETLDDLTRVVDPASQDYIVANLQYLATLEVPVLLRFAAEVNCWLSLSGEAGEAADAQRRQFMDAYIAAFRHVAALADVYAPNVAMVFAPLDASNFYVSPLDFYPGDDVVDWVSVNTYQNNAAAQNTPGSGNDAYYSVGLYDDQLSKLIPFIEAFGDRKPLMIGECGFCYSAPDGIQNETYAAEKLRWFYTYVNMLFPQIKAVLFFDNDMHGNCFSLDGSAAVKQAYLETTEANLPMQSTLGNRSRLSYRPLDGFSEQADALTLTTYASFPTDAPVSVSYALCGDYLTSSTEAPYTCIIPRQALRTGDRIEVTVTCAETVRRLAYVVVLDGETITVCDADSYTPTPKPVKSGYTDDAVSGGNPRP